MSITSYGVKGMLGAALNAATPLSNQLAILMYVFETTLSPGQSEKLDFLGAVPGLQKWAGKRQNATPIEHNYSIQIDKFESSIELPKDWIDNDKTKLVQQRINDLAARRIQHYGKRAAALINENGNCWDGKAFYANDHSWGGNTVDNNLTKAAATGVVPTALEFAEAVFAAYTALISFVDDKGEPINEDITELSITCSPTLAAAGLQGITNSQIDTGSGTMDNPINALKGLGITLKLIASPRLTSAVKFQTSITNGSHVPFVLGRNAKSALATAKAAGSDFEHDKDAWSFGVKEVTGDGYGNFTDSVQTEFI